VLVSVNHLGDPSYFAGVEPYLADADVVITEGPSPDEPDSRPALRGELRWLEKLETLFCMFLPLRTQGQWEARVRTTTWVTADLPDVEADATAQESGLVLLSDEHKTAIDRLLSLDPMKLDHHALSETREWLYRMVYAPFFGDGENLLSSRPWLLLMERREKVMLEGLKQVLGRMPAPRKVVVILGAFHMPRIEEYLRNVAQYTLWGSHWHDAVSYAFGR
jgi:hypothetical protein